MRRLGFLAVSLILLITLVGCTGQSSSAESQKIVAQTISALNRVTSVKIDTDVVNLYKVTSAPEPNVTTIEWKGTKSIDISNREMAMTMEITGYSDFSIEMYIQNGWEYLKATTPGLSNRSNFWDKYQLTDKVWAMETQISYYEELLKSAGQTNLQESESINGSDCYVLSFVPSVQAIIDWVISQEQPGVGPAIDVMFGGGIPVVREDAYQNSSVKLWIDKSSYLPLKAQVAADFNGYVGGGAITTNPYTPTTNPVNSSFSGQVVFLNYNQPLTFQLPQEALNAQEH